MSSPQKDLRSGRHPSLHPSARLPSRTLERARLTAAKRPSRYVDTIPRGRKHGNYSNQFRSRIRCSNRPYILTCPASLPDNCALILYLTLKSSSTRSNGKLSNMDSQKGWDTSYRLYHRYKVLPCTAGYCSPGTQANLGPGAKELRIAGIVHTWPLEDVANIPAGPRP